MLKILSSKKLYFLYHYPGLFIFVVFLISAVPGCDGGDDQKEDSNPYSYAFPALSSDQLISLKQSSESIEGFFMTTDISDFDSTWANRGFYLYVCIRFLNNETVNSQLNQSAIPLVIQISNEEDKPEAEAILLFHPKTDGVFYHTERRHFNFLSSSIQIGKRKYLINDVRFNKKGKITGISFVEERVDLEELRKLLLEHGEDIYTNYAEYAKDISGNASENPFVETKGFARIHSKSCESWSFINYPHINAVTGNTAPNN